MAKDESSESARDKGYGPLANRAVELYRQRLTNVINEKPVNEASFAAIFDLIRTCGDGCDFPDMASNSSYILDVDIDSKVADGNTYEWIGFDISHKDRMVPMYVVFSALVEKYKGNMQPAIEFKDYPGADLESEWLISLKIDNELTSKVYTGLKEAYAAVMEDAERIKLEL